MSYDLTISGARVDVSFHLIIKTADARTLGQDLPALFAAGHSSFNAFLTYAGLAQSDRKILEGMDVARAHSAMVMLHAENEDDIEFLRDKAEASGVTGPVNHARTRPVPVEREATHRAISLAETAAVSLMIVQVSKGAALEEITRAPRRGVKVLAETCPQYNTLTADDLDRAGFEEAKDLCSPPPHDSKEPAAIRAGLERGDFDLFLSDHCPFRFADAAGQDAPGTRASFRDIPNGIPGEKTHLPILFFEREMKGRISLPRFAAITATKHARLYGPAPRKGTIAVGADKEITLWDPALPKPIRQADLHHGSEYTPREGFSVTGWPMRCPLRGQTAARTGEITATARGNDLHRSAPELML